VDMGSETSGGIRNVVIQNCVMDSGNSSPIRFKSAPSRGGVVENITYRNLTLHETRQAISMEADWKSRAMARQPTLRRPIRCLSSATSGSSTCRATRSRRRHQRPCGQPVRGITFQNCHITANTGLRISHARDIDLSGLTLDVKDGLPLQDDVQ